jgi:hypothetical protein
VDILCPNCELENWLENQSRCLNCGAILRRCVDCVNYAPRNRQCRKLTIEIEAREAEYPTLLSASTNCRQYSPRLLVQNTGAR